MKRPLNAALMVVTGAALVAMSGCGGSEPAASTAEEVANFKKADLSKASPEVRATVEAAQKQGGGPPPQAAKK